MAEYNFKFDWNKISTLGKVRILVEQVVGQPSQAQISQAVADYIDSHPGALSPLSAATKAALLQIAEKVAYVDENGQDYYDALDAALNAKALLSITAVYTQSGTVYDTDSLDSLKADLVVTAYYDDGTSADVTSASVLSGTLAEGTSTVTVAYSGYTTTFTVTVSHNNDTTVQLDTDHMNKGQSATFGNYTSKAGFCPTIKYAISTSKTSGYDYLCGIIPVSETGSTTCRVWYYRQDDSGTAGSAYGTGKPMQAYSESMTEGNMSFSATEGYAYMTIPVGVNYVDDAYLYIQSTGEVLFAGRNTPYYGMSNISEAQ